MNLTTTRAFKTFQADDLVDVEVPQFMVLTGLNGAGKSNLLEAIYDGAVTYNQLGHVNQSDIRLFRLGELLAVAEGSISAQNFKQPWDSLFQFVQTMASNSTGSPDSVIKSNVELNVVQNKMLSQEAIDTMTEKSGKELHEMDIEDFRNHSPLIARVRDPFTTSLSELFLSYAYRRYSNELAQWRQETKGRGAAISDPDFESRFGRPPWEVLTETLRIVGLPYVFNTPPEDIDGNNVTYEVKLIDESKQEFSLDNLSSGERVLLAIAISLFAGTHMTETVELPKILLLDEADASLHPSMVKNLLNVILEIFVGHYSLNVILTTHSATTVALAPQDSLMVLSRDQPRLARSSRDQALSVLTVGITALSVQVENRRQVFVESEYDQEIYQNLARAVRPRKGGEISLEFIAAGKNGVAGGCDSVIRFVSELRAAGNVTVSGVVDRDARTSVVANVFYMDERYSIENFILDPVLLGSLLLRETILPPEQLGLPIGTRHYEIRVDNAQSLVNAVVEKLGMGGETSGLTEYAGGFALDIPESFFSKQGHDLEDHVLDTFPALRRFKTKLLSEVTTRVVVDSPQLVPLALIKLFDALSSP